MPEKVFCRYELIMLGLAFKFCLVIFLLCANYTNSSELKMRRWVKPKEKKVTISNRRKFLNMMHTFFWEISV